MKKGAFYPIVAVCTLLVAMMAFTRDVFDLTLTSQEVPVTFPQTMPPRYNSPEESKKAGVVSLGDVSESPASEERPTPPSGTLEQSSAADWLFSSALSLDRPQVAVLSNGTSDPDIADLIAHRIGGDTAAYKARFFTDQGFQELYGGRVAKLQGLQGTSPLVLIRITSRVEQDEVFTEFLTARVSLGARLIYLGHEIETQGIAVQHKGEGFNRNRVLATTTQQAVDSFVREFKYTQEQ